MSDSKNYDSKIQELIDQNCNLENLDKNFEEELNKQKTLYKNGGRVIQVNDSIAYVRGLDCGIMEELEFSNGAIGFVIGICEHYLIVPIINENIYGLVEGETIVFSRQCQLSVNVNIPLGSVINYLGESIDGSKITDIVRRNIFNEGVPIIDRQAVDSPLFTGIKTIDMCIPIGLGQRELILGDRCTGKTDLCLSIVVFQEKIDPSRICIYVAIGKQQQEIAIISHKLSVQYGLKNFIIVAATASDSSAALYIAPYTATSIGEFYSDQGRDVVIIYDDLTRHSEAYREMSLILQVAPGREAFPANIFYVHSSLLERSGNFLGKGSITALPILELQEGDITAYIPTNIVSITDGQIVMDKSLFLKGYFPAINWSQSVSRVGSSAQFGLLKELSKGIKGQLCQYGEMVEFYGDSDDVEESIKIQLDKLYILSQLLCQKNFENFYHWEQAIVLKAYMLDYINDKDNIYFIVRKILKYFNMNSEFIKTVNSQNDWRELESSVEKLLSELFCK